MAAWLKMATTVMVAVLPGGFLFLLIYAVVRALVAHARAIEAEAGKSPGTAFKALVALRPADVLREARTMSGFRAAA